MSAPPVSSVVRTLQQEMINGYAVASGDHNPIHTDEDYARTTPMGGTIAHGMLVLAIVSEMMTATFGREWLKSGKLDVRFRAPSRPGDVVTASASASDGAAEGRQRYLIECTNQQGELLISGRTEVNL